MADTISVFGHPVKKSTAGLFGVAAVLVVGFGLYQSRKNKTAATAAAPAAGAGSASPADQFPPDGTVGNPSDPYSTDPQTGMTYGDESSGYGGLTGYGSVLGGLGGGAGIFGGFTGGGVPPGPGYFTSDAQWAQYVEQLMGSSGDDSISAAIGKYITGQPVTADQQTIIEQAIAVGGYPPVAGTGGFPPSINTGGTTGGPPPPPPRPPPPPGPKPRTLTVPHVTGMRVEDATAALREAGFRSSFGPRRPGVPYVVKAQSPAGGAQVPAPGEAKPPPLVTLTIAPLSVTEIPGGPMRRA